MSPSEIYCQSLLCSEHTSEPGIATQKYEKIKSVLLWFLENSYSGMDRGGGDFRRLV